MATAALAVATIAFLWPSAAAAATFTVETTADGQDAFKPDGVCATTGGQCTLRAAVEQADFDPGLDTIDVPAGTYTLDEPNLEAASGDELAIVISDVVINGAGAGATILRQDEVGRVLELSPAGGAAEVNGVTIRDGTLANVGPGVFIGDESATVTIRDAVITNNQAIGGDGAGIWNIGSLVLERTTVSENSTLFSGRGAGIFNDNEADLLRAVASTIANNTADDISGSGQAEGAGLYIDGPPPVDGPVVLDRTTVSGNAVTGSGLGDGGGIHNAGDLTLASSTIAANSGPVGANLFRTFESVTSARNSLLADATGGASCAAPPGGSTPISQGYNLDEDGSCGLAGAPGDLAGTDPLLGPLAANGGPTLTHPLPAGSPAIDAGLSAAGETADQRGSPRPFDVLAIPNAAGGNGADIGSFEAQEQLPSPSATCKGKSVTIQASGPRTPGTPDDDVIAGRKERDRISGKGGNDLICAKGGNDKVKGGGGKDKLLGQRGRDRLDGGRGEDTCKGGPGKDRLRCERGR